MQDGIYRLQYTTATLSQTGLLVLEQGELAACDRYYFMCGRYRQNGNRIDGSVTFTRHTERADQPDGIPQQFELVFTGIGSDNFGQFDVHCPAIPIIKGQATFTWLSELNAQTPAPAAGRV